MKVTVTFTEKEKEILKELNDIYVKISTDDDIFDCNHCSCDDCPFHNAYSDCAINNLLAALKSVTKTDTDKNITPCENDNSVQKVSDEKTDSNSSFEKVKNFLKEKFPNGIQMFRTHNLCSDEMVTIYHQDNIVIEHCSAWEYIEVFGLTRDEFLKLEEECGDQSHAHNTKTPA